MFRFRFPAAWEQFTEESGLTSRRLRSLLRDREGNLWIGTDGGGLNRLKPRPWRMITRREGLGVDAVHSLSEDNQGRIWYGGGTSKPYWLREGTVSAAIPAPLCDPMAGVWAVLGTREGAAWIGTYWGRAFRYREGVLTAFTAEEGIHAGSVRALLEDRQGGVWVGGTTGLSRIEGQRVTHFSRRDGLSSERVWALAGDAQGNLLIGTGGGAPRTPQVARSVLNLFARVAGPPPEQGLSEREKATLEFLVQGLTTKEIADRLALSIHTVDTHLRNIYRKLHVHSRAGAVAKALQARLR